MVTKICNKCGIEKNMDSFEYRLDRKNYRNTCKECRNKIKKENYDKKKDEINTKRREHYSLHREELLSKRNDKSKPQDITIKLKKQLKRALDKSFTRKELKRQKTYEELLCCSIDEAIDYLINGYEKRYKKSLTINDEVDIDHILSLWSAYKQESIEKLCCYKNLRLLTKRDNHNRKYKITKEDSELITEYLEFFRKYGEEKIQKK